MEGGDILSSVIVVQTAVLTAGCHKAWARLAPGVKDAAGRKRLIVMGGAEVSVGEDGAPVVWCALWDELTAPYLLTDFSMRVFDMPIYMNINDNILLAIPAIKKRGRVSCGFTLITVITFTINNLYTGSPQISTR